jgi:hypothetical protein
MNPTDATLSRQAILNENTVIPYDDPSWFLSPVHHNGYLGDADFWEEGPAIPPDAVFWPAPRTRSISSAKTNNGRPARRAVRHE